MEKDNTHRKFSLTLQPKTVFNSFKESVKKGEYSHDDLMHIFRMVADQLNREDIHNNILMYNYIKGRTERAFIQQKKRVGMK